MLICKQALCGKYWRKCKHSIADDLGTSWTSGAVSQCGRPGKGCPYLPLLQFEEEANKITEDSKKQLDVAFDIAEKKIKERYGL